MGKRVAVILLGYLSACLAAGLAYGISGYLYQGELGLLFWISGMLVFGFYAVIFGALPTIVGIIYAERNRVRAIAFYLIGGALAGPVSSGLLAILLIWSAGKVEGFVSGDTLRFIAVGIGLFGTYGAISGLVYWLVAGRNAGQWR